MDTGEYDDNYSQELQAYNLNKSPQKLRLMSKVYYYHTTKLEVTKIGIVPACTIALRKEGNKFVYGLSICSRYDNFSKKEGRRIAEKRLNEGFGELEVPKKLEGLTEHQACMTQLFALVKTVVLKNRKWKRRVTRFNLWNSQPEMENQK